MWMTGPGRKIAKLHVMVGGSAFLLLLWGLLALAVCVAIQKLLVLTTGGWDLTPIGALLGGATGLLVGGVTEELWWRRRRRHTSSARGECEQVASPDQPSD
jgi:hypothetical protein